jgi:hypothetical protein
MKIHTTTYEVNLIWSKPWADYLKLMKPICEKNRSKKREFENMLYRLVPNYWFKDTNVVISNVHILDDIYRPYFKIKVETSSYTRWDGTHVEEVSREGIEEIIESHIQKLKNDSNGNGSLIDDYHIKHFNDTLTTKGKELVDLYDNL